MMKYYNERRKNAADFVWIFVKGELVSPEEDYKNFLTSIYVKAQSLFISPSGEIVNGKENKRDFN